MTDIYRVGGYRGSDKAYFVVAPDGREVWSHVDRREAALFAEELNARIAIVLGRQPDARMA